MFHREEIQLELEEILDKFDEEDLEKSISILNIKKIKLSDVESDIEKVNIKLESLYERKDHLDSHKYNEDCDICMENSQTILETKEKVESEIKKNQSELQGFEKEKLEFNLEIDSLKGYEKEWKNFQESFKQKEDKIDREISQLINKLSTTETEEYKFVTQINKKEQLIEEYYKNEKQIKKNKEIRDEIVDVRSDLDKVKQIIKNNKRFFHLMVKTFTTSKSKRNY